MTATSLLQELRTKGFWLTIQGDQITVDSPKGALTDDLRQAIKAHKPALLALLAQHPVPTPALSHAVSSDVIEERAAIYEYDGHMTRAAAEALAAHGHVVGLPVCPRCNGMAYQYEDGYVRCTTPWCGERADT